MLAFEIRVNGKELCVGGIGEAGALSEGIVSVVGHRGDDLFLDFGGLVSRTEEHVRWIKQKALRSGDEIRVTIIDAKTISKPVEKFRRDLSKETADEKRYVRSMAKKSGWVIQPRPKAKTGK